MAINLDALLINIVVSSIIAAPALWLAGRAVVGKEKAKFIDALWITVLGIVVGSIFGAFFTGFLATIIGFVIWLLLVRHFFEATWSQALVVAIINVIIWVVIALVLGLLGFAVLQFI